MSGDIPPPVNKTDNQRIPDTKESPIRLSIPVTVILERRMISRSFWSLPSWYLHAVAVGEHLVASDGLSSGAGVAAGRSDKGDLFAWSGFEVMLYKDACERYWHALIGDKPLVYVVCRDKSDAVDSSDAGAPDLAPVIVTVDYDDASASSETDSPVLSAPIPSELYRYMERFVLTHYQPSEFKKRKRRKWTDDQAQPHGKRASDPGGRDQNRTHDQ